MQQRFKRCIPGLDLSRVKVGSSHPVKNLADGECVSESVAAREAELCLDAGSIREQHLHPHAPLQDSRCYIYRAIGQKVGHEHAAWPAMRRLQQSDIRQASR